MMTRRFTREKLTQKCYTSKTTRKFKNPDKSRHTSARIIASCAAMAAGASATLSADTPAATATWSNYVQTLKANRTKRNRCSPRYLQACSVCMPYILVDKRASTHRDGLRNVPRSSLARPQCDPSKNQFDDFRCKYVSARRSMKFRR